MIKNPLDILKCITSQLHTVYCDDIGIESMILNYEFYKNSSIVIHNDCYRITILLTVSLCQLIRGNNVVLFCTKIEKDQIFQILQYLSTNSKMNELELDDSLKLNYLLNNGKSSIVYNDNLIYINTTDTNGLSLLPPQKVHWLVGDFSGMAFSGYNSCSITKYNILNDEYNKPHRFYTE